MLQSRPQAPQAGAGPDRARSACDVMQRNVGAQAPQGVGP